MDDRDREIAQLAFYGELTSAAVARVMGIPAGTVRWRISVIRRRVRKACGRSHETK
jgi:DNA-directed RNA polymerase specialized sigma24 family protein